MRSTNLVDRPHSQASPAHDPLERVPDPVVAEIHVIQVDMLSERGKVLHIQPRRRQIECHGEAEVRNRRVGFGKAPGRERCDNKHVRLLAVRGQSLNQAGVAGRHVLHEHEDEFLLREAHEWDGGEVEWAVCDWVQRRGSQYKVGRWVGFPPEDFDVVGFRGRCIEGLDNEGRHCELSGNHAALMIDAHDDREQNVEDSPTHPEDAIPYLGSRDANTT